MVINLFINEMFSFAATLNLSVLKKISHPVTITLSKSSS